MRPLIVLGLSGLVFAAVIVTTGAVGWALAAAGLNDLVNYWVACSLAAGFPLSFALADRLAPGRRPVPMYATIHCANCGAPAHAGRSAKPGPRWDD
jgi:hypothetical protein